MIKSIFFSLETCEQCAFCSEKLPVNFQPTINEARALEFNMANSFVVSTACGSGSH